MTLIHKENGTICSTSEENIGKTILFEGEVYFVARDGDASVEFSLRNIFNKLNFENNEYFVIIGDDVITINNIVVTHVTDMNKLFDPYNKDTKIEPSLFNHPLDNWDVSNVTKMVGMFHECKVFNQPLNNWEVYNVTDMNHMFAGCKSFNQPLDIGMFLMLRICVGCFGIVFVLITR